MIKNKKKLDMKVYEYSEISKIYMYATIIPSFLGFNPFWNKCIFCNKFVCNMYIHYQDALKKSHNIYFHKKCYENVIAEPKEDMEINKLSHAIYIENYILDMEEEEQILNEQKEKLVKEYLSK